MGNIELQAGCLLLKKVVQAKSEFVVTGAVDPNTPLYEVAFTGDNTNGIHGPLGKSGKPSVVILKPGSYENMVIDGVTYLYAEISQIAGRIV